MALRPPKTLMLNKFKIVQTRTIKLGDFAEICLRTVLIAIFFKIYTFSRFTFNELLYHCEGVVGEWLTPAELFRSLRSGFKPCHCIVSFHQKICSTLNLFTQVYKWQHTAGGKLIMGYK